MTKKEIDQLKEVGALIKNLINTAPRVWDDHRQKLHKALSALEDAAYRKEMAIYNVYENPFLPGSYEDRFNGVASLMAKEIVEEIVKIDPNFIENGDEQDHFKTLMLPLAKRVLRDRVSIFNVAYNQAVQDHISLSFDADAFIETHLQALGLVPPKGPVR